MAIVRSFKALIKIIAKKSITFPSRNTITGKSTICIIAISGFMTFRHWSKHRIILEIQITFIDIKAKISVTFISSFTNATFIGFKIVLFCRVKFTFFKIPTRMFQADWNNRHLSGRNDHHLHIHRYQSRSDLYQYIHHYIHIQKCHQYYNTDLYLIDSRA